MLNKIFSLIIALLMLFTFQSQTFAAVNQAEKVEQSIQIEKDQFFEQSLPYEMAKRERSRDNDDSESTYGNPSLAGLWWLSIFITGLGQLVMGDFWRGLSFYGWAILATIIAYAINPYSSSVVSTLIFIIAIWNVIDAYMMSVEITEGRDQDSFLNNSDSKMAKLEERLKELEKISKNINMSGSNFSFKALAF
jgi:hypothetical protein